MLAWSVPDWLAEVAKLAAAITVIVAAAATISKKRAVRWVFHRVVGEPMHDAAVELITATVAAPLDELRVQLATLEAKNDAQHGENKTAIAKIDETLAEHKLETRDHLWELRQQTAENHQLLVDHFTEATRRDERITALEQRIDDRGDR